MPKSNASRAAKCILLVEDDESSRAAIALVLQNAGYEVEVAPDYKDALTVIESAKPVDLLFTDIVMPQKVNGLALGRMARMRRPTLRILYMTGYDIPGVENEAMGPVLRKPIDNDVLLAEIEKVLAAPKRD